MFCFYTADLHMIPEGTWSPASDHQFPLLWSQAFQPEVRSSEAMPVEGVTTREWGLAQAPGPRGSSWLVALYAYDGFDS